MPAKFTLQHCQNVAQSNEGFCLAEEYLGFRSEMPWLCKKGHFWDATLDSATNWWCPGCSSHDIGWLNEAANKHEGFCLEVAYRGIHFKHKWRCKQGHEWFAEASSVVNGAKWCDSCVRWVRNIDSLHELADKFNGKCLSTKYTGNKTYYIWQCCKGHTWKAKANNVQQGFWCPHCIHKHSKQEIEVYEKVKEVYHDALLGQRSLLKNKQFEIDVYVPSIRVGIEVDGPRHDPNHKIHDYKPQDRFKQFNRDRIKDAQCIEAGIKLHRIKYDQYEANKKAVLNDLLSKLSNNLI